MHQCFRRCEDSLRNKEELQIGSDDVLISKCSCDTDDVETASMWSLWTTAEMMRLISKDESLLNEIAQLLS